jgi:AcrR family transcriptional regulator
MHPQLPSIPVNGTRRRRRVTAKTKRSMEPDPRARLIKAGAELFCRYGINATGVDAVVNEAGTAKATLYKIFGSKEGLVEAVLEAEGEVWRTWFIQEIDAMTCSEAQKLIRLFDILKAWFSDQSFYGCPFINAVGEHDKSDDRIRNVALRHKGVVLNKIKQLATAAGASDPEGLTHELALLIDGAIVATLITSDPTMADTARRAAERIVVAEIGAAA